MGNTTSSTQDPSATPPPHEEKAAATADTAVEPTSVKAGDFHVTAAASSALPSQTAEAGVGAAHTQQGPPPLRTRTQEPESGAGEGSSDGGRIFFGSQTGTARRLANKLAASLRTRHGITFEVTDLATYDPDGEP